jgi:hypothetical protein
MNIVNIAFFVVINYYIDNVRKALDSGPTCSTAALELQAGNSKNTPKGVFLLIGRTPEILLFLITARDHHYHGLTTSSVALC